jgi:hypothetical protein
MRGSFSCTCACVLRACQGFCVSAKHACKLLLENAARVAALQWLSKVRVKPSVTVAQRL